MVSKSTRATRKGHTNFLLFHFWDLKLVPINSALNPASGNLTHFFFKYRHGTKKSNQTWKSNWNFSEMILTYLDSVTAEVFPHHCWSLSMSVILRRKQVVKVGPRVQNLGPSLFHKNWNPPNSFQCFCLLECYYFWWEFQQYWIKFGWVRAWKPPKKGELVCNTFKINITSTNATLMKRLCIFIRV